MQLIFHVLHVLKVYKCKESSSRIMLMAFFSKEIINDNLITVYLEIIATGKYSESLPWDS